MNESLVSTSKFLSLVLRHKPEVIGMQLDPEGWLEIAALLDKANQHGHSLTLELLHEVVATNDKKRFSLSDDGLRIRANQGHSITAVDLKLEPATPPGALYHGTVEAFLGGIRKHGLLKRSRNHVHLSADELTATKVGSRRGKPIVLTVAAARMHQAGHQFYLSANGVWLTEAVPAEYLTFPAESSRETPSS
ncbi:RNA 2'-phosphotransferase [Candidatus Laterigemmans baculatus]|uniref:RNA 2'-phosphotransferase n=1 Tax=Candidatus Laterigemmans baculatus TaxID=2770505 RepID=UPI0013DC06A0|nr:RNA 2'-phosphotransferase [Candidatus Laterigemmans baculatus]